MMMATYNPYQAVYNIVQQKGYWTDADRKYRETKDKQYQDAKKAAQSSAVQWYEELRNAGYGSLADELSKADLTTAYQILSRYQPTQSVQETVQPALVSSIGSAGSSSFPTYLQQIAPIAQPSPQAQAANEAALRQAQQLYNNWLANNAQTQAQAQRLSNETYRWIQELYNTGRSIQDYALSTNPYTSDIGKAIMASYMQQGDTAARNVTADIAGSNSGNIDSYSAANARRQQLAFINAGNQAILQDHNARVANALAVLESLGVNTRGLLGIEQQNVEGARNYNINLLSGVNTAMGTATSSANESDRLSKSLISDLAGYMSGLLQTENTNASNLAGQLIQSEAALRQQQLVNEVQNNLARLQTDAELTKAKLDNATQQAIAAMQYASAEKVADIRGQYDLLIQEAATRGVISQADANRYAAMVDAEARKYSAMADAEARKYSAMSDAEARKYSADKSLEATKYATDAEATMSFVNAVVGSNTGATNESNPSYNMLKAAIETFAEENGGNWRAAGAQVLIPFAQHPAYSAIKQLVDAIVNELETQSTSTTNSIGTPYSGSTTLGD